MNGFQNRQLQRNFYTINIASIVELLSDLTFIQRCKHFFQEFLYRTIHSQVKRLKMICHVSWNINNYAIITFDNFLESGRCFSLIIFRGVKKLEVLNLSEEKLSDRPKFWTENFSDKKNPKVFPSECFRSKCTQFLKQKHK